MKIEALDALAEIALKKHPERIARLREIKAITDLGMRGVIGFDESLEKRLKLFSAARDDVSVLIRMLKQNITESVARNKEFFRKYKDYIYVISGGFKEYIYPLFKPFGIAADHILANEFVFNGQGVIEGFDGKNLLAQAGGKVKQIRKLKLKGTIYVIGDGYTDWQIREAGEADKFFVFVENVRRENVAGKADHVVPNFDEFLYVNKLPRAYSYPKNRIRVIVFGKVPKKQLGLLKKEGYEVQFKPDETPMIMIGNHAVGVWEENKVNLERYTRDGVVVFTDKIVRRLIRYINTGETSGSVNFPKVELPALKGAHRIIHIHRNVPGVLAHLNTILAKRKVNILGQYLATNDQIGIVLIDVNKSYDDEVIKEIRQMPTTIKLRVLY